MATAPISLRLEKDLLDLLSEGKRRTPLNQQQLVRRTLRLHLRAVIESEAKAPRLTAVSPWPRGALAKAYKRTEKDWNEVESAAIAAQGVPSWGD